MPIYGTYAASGGECDPERFKAGLALLFLPLLSPFASLMGRLMPERVAVPDPSRPAYLDAAAIQTPALALAGAGREALRMADVLAEMVGSAADVIERGDRSRILGAQQMDDVLDRLNAAIKAYVTQLDPEALSDADEERVRAILAFTTHLEHAGDIVDHSLMSLAAKRLKRGLAFSEEGKAEISALLERISVNLRSAASVFMSADVRAARLLAAEKAGFRDLESRATEAHFQRLRRGLVPSAETSALHLDLVRDLKRINDHLVAGAAYPVLEREGELLPSRIANANEPDRT